MISRRGAGLRSRRISLWIFPVAAMLLISAWQGATVAANFGGNWTALFCTGALQPHPPLVYREHIYLFPDSTGYDGQFFHYMAHDPLLRSDLKTYFDDPRLRYRRILIPLLAYGLAFGRTRLIDPLYELLTLASIGLGVYWCGLLARQAQLSAAWGLMFLPLPATAITADRLVVDAALAALTAALLCYRETPWKVLVVLACAALTRETGLLLIAAYGVYSLWRREIRGAAIALLSGAPAAGWYLYLRARTTHATLPLTLFPFTSILQAFANPWQYPPGTPFPDMVRAADYLALAGLVLAFAMACVCWIRRPSDLAHLAAMAFTAMGLMMNVSGTLQSVYHFGRIYTPLLLCLAAVAARNRKPWLLAPLALILPRIAIQLAPQALGIVRWIV